MACARCRPDGEGHTLRVVPGEPIPLGGQPAPRRLLPIRPPFYPFQPQRAWLEDSVLAVEYKGQVRRCDLISAWEIALMWTPVNGTYWSFRVLLARQEPDSEPVRLVVEGPDWVLLTAAQLRMLAQIIGSRPGEPERRTRKILRYLRQLADKEELRTNWDWSFRTDPQGRRTRAQ